MATHKLDNEVKTSEVSVREIESMAKILKKRHGRCAYAIAHYFALEHENFGDEVRSENWQRVASLIKKKRFC